MTFFVTDSTTELFTDTLPALKIKYYYQEALRDNVYSYARLYFYNGSLRGAFTSFDDKPLASNKMSLCVKGEHSEQTLVISIGKSQKAKAYIICENLSEESGKNEIRDFNADKIVTGEDEQGVFWSVNFKISADAIKSVFGKTICAGDILACNLYLHSDEEKAFASAFECCESEDVLKLSAKGGQLVVVPY